MQIDRQALLQAAARFDSQSSDSESQSQSGSDTGADRRKAERKKESSKQKKRKSKHSSKKSHKSHKRHKRSDHEKIADLERRAAAMGAGSMLPSFQNRLGFGRYSSATAAASTGDAVTLDTEGDANNALYESLYGGDVPRYNRLDPLDLVRVSRRLGGQLLAGDADTGNTTADRYYRGRHYLQERNRSAKRINLADLRRQHHKQGVSSSRTQHGGQSMLLLAATTPLMPPAAADGKAGPGSSSSIAAGSATLQQQAQQSSSNARRLAIPAPAFIPLEAPEGLLQQAGDAGAAGGPGSWQQQLASSGGSGRQKALAPTELVEQAGVTPDDLLLQATRAWNVAVRERPHEEELWLEFAAFQHSAAQQQQQRSRAVSTGLLDPITAEKQISLLSRGLTHHPSSAQLLLALLRCYTAVAPDADALEAKWAAVLLRQGGSWELWREYVALRQSSFADFKVSGVEKAHLDALHSLQLELLAHRRKAAAAHKQQHRQPALLSQQEQQQLSPLAAAAAAAAAGSSTSSGLGLALTLGEEVLELQLVQLLLSLLFVELEAGLCEQALAKVQALLEFHLFPPPLPPGGVPALLRLFAAYWMSGVPRIGEAGARGWAYWCCWHAMGMEQPTAAAAGADEEVAEVQKQEEPAGWSGWFEVPHGTQQDDQQQQQQQALQGAAAGAATVEQAAPSSSPEGQEGSEGEPGAGGGDGGAAAADADIDAEAEDEEEGELSEGDDAVVEDDDAAGVLDEEELDEEELMRQLGLHLEQQLQEVEKEGLPADVLARWVQEEASCSASFWQPLRPDGTPPAGTSQPQADDAHAPPDPARVAGLGSVEPCLFLLRSAAALRRLVLGCVELLGVPLGADAATCWCSSNVPTPMQQQALMDVSTAGPHSSSGSGSSKATAWSNATADHGPGSSGCYEQQQQQQQQQQWQQAPWCAASDERWRWAVNLLQRLVAGGPCSDWPELCRALILLHAQQPSTAAARPAARAEATGQAEQQQQQQPGQQEAGVLPGDVGGSLHSRLQQLTLDGAAVGVAGGAPDTAAPGATAAAQAGSSSQPRQQQLAAARAAAKQLLGDQQDNLLLYDAYGCLEAAAGQVKTARKVFETALALATTAAAGSSTTGEAAGQSQETAAAAAPVLAMHLAQLELSAGGKTGPVKAHVALHAVLAGQQLQAVAAAEAAAGASNQQQQQQGGGLLSDAQLRAARVRFQQHIPELSGSAGGFLTATASSTIAAAALFELAVGLRRGDAAAGVDAAVAVCRQVTAATPDAIRATSAHHEQLTVLQCHILVAAATGNSKCLAPGLSFSSSSSSSAGKQSSSSSGDAAVSAALAAAVPPVRAREALASGLQLYPHSKGLLQLQVALDHACYTLAGLRRQLAALTEINPSPGLWAVALQAEALRPGGRVRLGVLFERALAAPTALQWHQQERLQRQKRQQAWTAAACPGLEQQQQQQLGRQGVPSAAEQRQQLLLQHVSAAGSAAAMLDLAVWDGYRGWGHCSTLWQQYIQYELRLGRRDAARKLFLRAVHATLGSKALWLSGLGAVCAGLQPRECSGLLNVMQEREVTVRTDVYEVLLAAVAEKQQMQL